MPDLPNGRYGVTIQNWETSYSGVLDTTTGTPTYDLAPGYQPGDSAAITSFNDNSGSIGWECTINGTPVTFAGGTYNPGPPITITGGTASASGMEDSPWSVDALPNGNYDVTTSTTPDANGKLVVSGQPGSQSLKYQFGGIGTEHDCSSPNLTSGQVGWVVVDPANSTKYTFTDGVYIPLQGEPHTLSGGVVSSGPAADDDIWTADASSSEPLAHKQAAPNC